MWIHIGICCCVYVGIGTHQHQSDSDVICGRIKTKNTIWLCKIDEFSKNLVQNHRTAFWSRRKYCQKKQPQLFLMGLLTPFLCGCCCCWPRSVVRYQFHGEQRFKTFVHSTFRTKHAKTLEVSDFDFDSNKFIFMKNL